MSPWNSADDELDEREYPDEPEYDEDDLDTVRCDQCGADVWEEAQQCPHCGHYLVADTSPLRGRPWWWILVGLVGVIATIIALLQ